MGSDYHIRKTTLKDASGITALLQASYPVLLKPFYSEPVLREALPLMARAHEGLLQSGTYFVVVSDRGKFAGCGGWSQTQFDSEDIDPAVAYIRHFATHPDHLRQGIGGRILDRCLQEARSINVEKMMCNSTYAAEKFYASRGFRVTEKIEVVLRDGVNCPALLMRLQFGEV